MGMGMIHKMISNQSTFLQHYSPAAWLQVSGPDAAAFLQGQFTQDLRFEGGKGCGYGLWLNAKGKVQADSFVFATGAGAFYVGSYASPAATVRERLETFIIADDVTVDDLTGETRAVGIWGPGARALLERAGLPVPGTNGFSESERALVFRGRHVAEENFDIVVPGEAAASWEGKLLGALGEVGGHEVGANEAASARIAAAIPAIPVDLGPADLPNEGGLEAAALSYTKGCYTGQEVMARLKSMGQVRRLLRRVRMPAAPPALPAALYQGERKLGELRSIAPEADGFIGLAMITLMHLNPSAPLGFAPGAMTGAVLFPEDARRHG